jgi:hypothetical protein
MHPLLSNKRETNETTVVAKQRPANYNKEKVSFACQRNQS